MADQSPGTVLAERSEHRWHHQRAASTHRADRQAQRRSDGASSRVERARQWMATRRQARSTRRGCPGEAVRSCWQSPQLQRGASAANCSLRSRVLRVSPASAPAVAASEPYRSRHSRALSARAADSVRAAAETADQPSRSQQSSIETGSRLIVHALWTSCAGSASVTTCLGAHGSEVASPASNALAS